MGVHRDATRLEIGMVLGGGYAILLFANEVGQRQYNIQSRILSLHISGPGYLLGACQGGR